MKYVSYLLTLFFFVFKWYRGIINIFCGFFPLFTNWSFNKCALWHTLVKCTTLKNLVWLRYKSLLQVSVRGHCTLQRNVVLQFDCVEFKQDFLSTESLAWTPHNQTSAIFYRRISRNPTNKTFQVRSAGRFPFVGAGEIENPSRFIINTQILFLVLQNLLIAHLASK